MKITEEMEDAVRLLEAKNPGLDIRAAVSRLHENDFAALVLQELAHQIPAPTELPHG